MSDRTNGKKYWRSLNELQNTEEFQEFLHREFPAAASEFPEGVSRRRWLQLMGASLALGGMTGCRYEVEKIAPLAVRPENRIPGKPQRYATSIELAGATRGLLVTCYDGRPIKVEGNPEHPASLGGTDVFSQATVLDLYDPDRSSDLRQRSGNESFSKSWEDFVSYASSTFATLRANEGAGLAVLLEPSTSVTLQTMLGSLKAVHPKAKLFTYAALESRESHAGSQAAFGKALATHFALDKAQAIVCLDADPLGDHPAATRMARDFVGGRDPESGHMNRLYVVESQWSVSGGFADHRLAIASRDIPEFLTELEATIAAMVDGQSPETPGKDAPRRERVLHAMAEDLVAQRGKGVIAVGSRQPAAVHDRVHRLNAMLENVGKTVIYTAPAEGDLLTSSGDISSLCEQISAGSISHLLILGGNPVYDAPADLKFADQLAGIEHSAHLSYYENETSQACQWHLPAAHPFESWGDCRGYDGTIGVTQPLIEPLLGGKSAIDLLAILLGDTREPQVRVREAIEAAQGSSLDDPAWQRLLHDGFLGDSQLPAENPELIEQAEDAEPTSSSGYEIVFCSSPNVYDGRFANNGWLQEMPAPLTKLTWDNAAILDPHTAEELGVEHGSVVTVAAGGQQVDLPVYVMPGQAEGSIGIALGYGRTAAGHVGGSEDLGIAPVGVDVNPLRTSKAMYIVGEAKVTKTGRSYPLATTQDHHAIDQVGLEEIGHRVGELVREGNLEHYQEDPHFVEHMGHHMPEVDLWKEVSYEGNAWGMAIDLNKCIGCNACTIACQAENNVPIVGKEQIRRGREMHWIRIDRYFHGDLADVGVAHQPVTCQHCENAPCEQVCPVAATVHSREGLNDMVYNRCVGTRYCANNCPYKVRRFNFFNYNKRLEQPDQQLIQLSVNPEVTVRVRGVMEKCTYCVQRIQAGKIDARNRGTSVADGLIVSACQQACPTRAIEFGDLNDATSRVAKAHADPRAYGLLSELKVKARTKYLARIRNPHPSLAEHDDHHGHQDGETHPAHTPEEHETTTS